jgi:chromate reductase
MTVPSPDATPRYNVLALVGSLRKDSANRVLFNAAVEVAPPSLRITEFTGLAAIPLYNQDLDGDAKPEPVRSLLEAIRRVDALLFVSPEYNYSIPGLLKNALDWASRGGANAPLRGKPAAIMGGSSGAFGSSRMQYHLRQSLLFTGNPVLVQPEVAVPRLHERIVGGRLSDESTRELVRKQLVAFDAWIGRFTPP